MGWPWVCWGGIERRCSLRLVPEALRSSRRHNRMVVHWPLSISPATESSYQISWIFLEAVGAWIQGWAERTWTEWPWSMLGVSLVLGSFLYHLFTSYEMWLLDSWVKHFSPKFATFDTFMVARVWEGWEEVCTCRFHPVLHLPFFYVLFPISQVAGWSEARESVCTLLGYLMGKFGPRPKSLIVRSEFFLKKFSATLERLPTLY